MIILKVIPYTNNEGLEATWLDGDVQVWCQSYHPTQMQMFRDKSAEYGTSLLDYEDLIHSIESSYTPPAPEPLSPVSCTAWQIRKALNAAGFREQVEAAISASGNYDLKDGWEFASEFRSDDALVLSMGTLLSFGSDQVREFIQHASTL